MLDGPLKKAEEEKKCVTFKKISNLRKFVQISKYDWLSIKKTEK